MAETSRSTNSMEVSLSILREIEVDDYIHRDDINTTCEQVSAN